MKLFRIRMRIETNTYGDLEVLAKDEEAATTMAKLVADRVPLVDPSPPDAVNEVYDCEEIQEPGRQGAIIVGSLTGKIEYTPLASRGSYTIGPMEARAYLAGRRDALKE